MKRVKTIVAQIAVGASLLMSPGPLRADETALLWFIDDPDILSGGGSFVPIDEYWSPDGHQIEGARVHVTGPGVDGEGGYLDLFAKDGTTLSGSMAQIDRNGDFGCTAGPLWASVGAYADPAYQFAIELGWFDGTDWKALAFSNSETWESIRKFTSASPTDVQGVTPWTVSTFAVPEPSGALLTLVGAACLALRRGNAAREGAKA